jgi:hypothetical protein
MYFKSAVTVLQKSTNIHRSSFLLLSPFATLMTVIVPQTLFRPFEQLQLYFSVDEVDEVTTFSACKACFGLLLLTELDDIDGIKRHNFVTNSVCLLP